MMCSKLNKTLYSSEQNRLLELMVFGLRKLDHLNG